MTTSTNELKHWMSQAKENEHLEFKEAKKQYDNNKLLRYCVAMANEGGGKFILGITDKLPRTIVGSSAFENLEKIQKTIFDTLRFRVDVEQVICDNKRILIFHIPSRPKGTAYSLSGTYYMRSGEDTIPMTEDRLRQIFSEGKPVRIG